MSKKASGKKKWKSRKAVAALTEKTIEQMTAHRVKSHLERKK